MICAHIHIYLSIYIYICVSCITPQVHYIILYLFYFFVQGTDYIIMSVQADQPDRFEIGGVHVNETIGVIDPATAPTGSWQYDEGHGTVKFLGEF